MYLFVVYLIADVSMLDGLRKTTKDLSQNRQSLTQNLLHMMDKCN
jgi:hypothetical protein